VPPESPVNQRLFFCHFHVAISTLRGSHANQPIDSRIPDSQRRYSLRNLALMNPAGERKV
jgi:hypothetical protein